MLALSLTLCGWQAKFKLPYPQQPFVDHNLVMKEMQSQQFVRKIHFLGVVAFQSKAKPTMAVALFNGRPFHQRHCSIASGCFFYTCLCVIFSLVLSDVQDL